MFKMNLVLRKTYYDLGYFNISVDLVKKYIHQKSGTCEFKINEIIFKKKYTTVNEEGQIRVYGNREICDFFQKKCKKNAMIEIEFLEFY